MRRERVSGRERERETKRGTFSCVWRIRERGEHFKRFEGKQKVKERQNEGEEHKEGNNVHLWFWWKSSERRVHLAWHIFTVHWMLVYLIIFHISPHMLVLHGPLESLTRILTTAETHQHTPIQLNSPREHLYSTNFMRVYSYTFSYPARLLWNRM